MTALLDGATDEVGFAAALKLAPLVRAVFVPVADIADGTHGTLCFWHSAQMALSGGIR